MASKQIVARDLALVLKDLRALAAQGRLDPVVGALLNTTIRLVDLLRRQTLAT